MDDIDRASEYEMIARGAALATVCTLAHDEIPKSAKCLNCGAKTEKGARWCDSDCMKDHQLRIKVI